MQKNSLNPKRHHAAVIMILSWTCALLLATPLALGGPSDPYEEYLEQLSLQPKAERGTVSLDGFLSATRIDATTASLIPESYLGTRIDHARLRLKGEIEGFSYHFGLDALNSRLSLQDAWISREVSPDVQVTLGQFRPPFLTSSLLDADRLLFPVRTRNGTFYSVRTPGLQVNGGDGRFAWSAAMQDGIIDPSDTLATMRLSYDFTGRGMLPWEGALGSNFRSHLWATAALSTEDVLESGTASALELHYVTGRYSFALELLDYGDDYDLLGGPWGPNPITDGRGERRGDTQPLSITATYMFVPDLVELAVRYEDFDDNGGDGYGITGLEEETDFNRSNLYFGLNYYVHDHDMKIHLTKLHESRDGLDDSDDRDIWAAGISLSF
jgi:hypothetical protein